MSITHVHIYFPSSIDPSSGDLVDNETVGYDLRQVVSWSPVSDIGVAETEAVQVRVIGLPFDARIVWPKDEFESAKQASLDAEPVAP